MAEKETGEREQAIAITTRNAVEQAYRMGYDDGVKAGREALHAEMQRYERTQRVGDEAAEKVALLLEPLR